MLRLVAAVVIVITHGHAHAARLSAGTREVVPLAAGLQHACAILHDGQVMCWGSGFLGAGPALSASFSTVATVRDVVALAAGDNSTCAVRADGTVWCWGVNANGQLGDGTTTVRETPVAVQGLDEVVAIAQSQRSYCARRANGQVLCWGFNHYGQLGDGSFVDRSTPVVVAGLAEVTSIAGGAHHFCASTAAGLVACWGNNTYLQMGRTSPWRQPTALTVPGLANIKQVGTAADSSCALNGQGEVSCWGLNVYGELGRGYVPAQIQSSATPAAVVGLTHVRTLAHGGGKHACAIRSDDGQLWCWGTNAYGQHGTGTPMTATGTPVRATTLADNAVFVATSVGDGPELAFGFTCALRGNGTIWCAGWNGRGQLGDHTTVDRASFVQVQLGKPVWNGEDVTTGEGTTCVGKSDGSSWCAGGNVAGQLGVGDTLERPMPAMVSGLFTSAAAVTANSGHSCVLMTDGTAACMGGNMFGSLGDGTTTMRTSATDVVGLVADKTATGISAGHDHHTCISLSDGRAKCWGSNASGEIGDGSITNRLTPTFVYNLNSVVQVAAGAAHSCALFVNGSVKCWGENDEGQLGDGSTAQRVLPVPVVGLASAAIAISAGRYHTCAQLVGGAVQCWGANYYGQLGNAGAAASPVPVHVRITGGATLSGAVALSAGNDHNCAIVKAGAVVCWGDNYYAQLGDGTHTQRAVATAITGVTNASRIAAGWYHSCARSANGSVSCWGQNSYGELADGTHSPRVSPAPTWLP